MKKLLLFSALLAAFAAFAAYDFQSARAIPLGASTTINSGATRTNAVSLVGLKGNAELLVYASGAAARTKFTVALWCTNDVSGWQPYAAQTYTSTNAGVYRVAFPGEGVSAQSRVLIGSTGAASTCWGLILAY